MSNFIATYFPNLNNYWDIFCESLQATAQMFIIGGILTLLIGLAFGIGLTVTKKDGIYPNSVIHSVLESITNLFRSIPFIILLIFLIPFTRFITGTAIGVRGAIVPIVVGCVPFFARQTESALSEVSPGKLEAARAMGSSALGLIFRVLLPESLPALIRAITITAISLIGLTTSAGAVGAGGIGSFAINYGQNLHYQDIVNVCVVVLLLVICTIQLTGNLLSKWAVNRRLLPTFHFNSLFQKSVKATKNVKVSKKYTRLAGLVLLSSFLFVGCGSNSSAAQTQKIKIGVPNDATNQSRALNLLDEAGLIEVDDAAGYTPELKDVTQYNYNIEIIPAAANILVSSLDDYGAASVNGTYAVPAGLDPKKDGLITEVQEVGSDNPFINVIVARTQDKDNETYKKIVEAYQSQLVAEYLITKNNGISVPAFEYDKTFTVDDPEAFIQEIEGYTAKADGSTVVKIGTCGSGEIFKAVQKQLDDSNENILLDVVVFDAYNLPNEALNNGEIDLNSFQHKAYLASEVASQGYDLVAIGDTSSAPLTLYSKKYTSIDELKTAAGKVE